MRDVAEQILCSKGFQQFFDKLQDNTFSVEQMIALIQKNFHFIVEELPIGKLTAQITAPKTVLEPNGKQKFFEIYCNSDGYEELPHIERFQNDESGNAIIITYPNIKHTWTESERKAIRFLSQNIFHLSEKAHLMGLMQKMSITDLLTGASNTNGFMQFGEALLKQGTFSKYTGMFINIKNFNYINQTVGPRYGDEILRKYAQMIKGVLLQDEILSRLGGDNFTALIQTERVKDFLQFMSNIKISVPYNNGIRSFDIRARIGLCNASQMQSMGETMNAMSAAFNIAKTSGQGDYIWFQPKMLENALHDKEISLIFPNALQNKEFVVYYQPKVTLADNTLCGCEALVRWIRNGKLVPPMEFIPILEREGTICRLDFYVLESVCCDIKNWIAAGIEPVRVSVNFSKIHLRNKNLANDIISVLKKYDVDSKYIEVELTEMSGYENYETLFNFVQIMKENGVSTSIDDFGTGYSSLNLLKDLNVDIIKLDKSFLNKIEQHQKTDEIVIKNIVNMVNELNMEVIAEGVETIIQATFLRNINCCMAQGFLFDRPLPHDDFEKRLCDRHTYTFQ